MKCPKCGKIIREDSLFCNHCGKKIEQEENAVAENTFSESVEAQEENTQEIETEFLNKSESDIKKGKIVPNTSHGIALFIAIIADLMAFILGNVLFVVIGLKGTLIQLLLFICLKFIHTGTYYVVRGVSWEDRDKYKD